MHKQYPFKRKNNIKLDYCRRFLRMTDNMTQPNMERLDNLVIVMIA